MFRLPGCLACLICGALIGAAGVWFSSRSIPNPALPFSPARAERPCDPFSRDTAIVVVHGQSNAGNYGTGRYAAKGAVDNFDPDTGKCFAAVDPLLGAGGTGANFATRLGDILIAAGRYRRVVIAPIAVGGASLNDLNTLHAHKIDNLIAKLKAAQLVPTHFLFEQGETDAAQTTTSDQYVTLLHQLVQRFRAAGYAAPFYVSQTTRCEQSHPANAVAIREGQRRAVSVALNIRAGPDTDTIGSDGRNSTDGCHMNEAGALANAGLWAAFMEDDWQR